MNKAQLLIKTADALLESKHYSWSDPRRCNIGHLIEVARGSRATIPEFMEGGGIGIWCRRGKDNHVLAWLRAEYGFTDAEIESIELLKDHSIVRVLARRGIRPAPMFNRSRKFVAEYLRVMGRRLHKSARRASRKTLVPVP